MDKCIDQLFYNSKVNGFTYLNIYFDSEFWDAWWCCLIVVNKRKTSVQVIQISFTRVSFNLNERPGLSLLKQIYNDRFFWRWPKLPWKKFNSPLFQNKQSLLVGIPCNPAHLSRVQNANSTGPQRTQN